MVLFKNHPCVLGNSIREDMNKAVLLSFKTNCIYIGAVSVIKITEKIGESSFYRWVDTTNPLESNN